MGVREGKSLEAASSARNEMIITNGSEFSDQVKDSSQRTRWIFRDRRSEKR